MELSREIPAHQEGNLLMSNQRVTGRKQGMLALVDGEEMEEETAYIHWRWWI